MEEDLQRKQQRMLTAPVEGLILSLSVPFIVIMLITAVYIPRRQLFRQRDGHERDGAIGDVVLTDGRYTAIGCFFGQARGTICHGNSARERIRKSRDMESTGFSFVACGAILTAMGLLFLNPCCASSDPPRP
jgi:hypothetical protein